MPGQIGRKLRHSDITEYRSFDDDFIITPQRSVLIGDQKLSSPVNEHSKTYPVLKVAKQPTNGSRWRLDSIPNLKGIPNGRMLPRLRAQPSREDTFDTDFMMPSRVREVLEDEGLENGVIHDVIGKAEEKYQKVLKSLSGPNFKRFKEKKPKPEIILPPLITTKKPLRHNARTPSSDSSWLDLKRQQPRDPVSKDMWEPPVSPAGRDEYLEWNFGSDLRHVVEDVQIELDRKKWLAAQHVEQLYSGDNYSPPRVVLISSRVPKCHILTKVYQEDVIPVIYDFDSSTFTEILDAITKKLDLIGKNCKAKSIMVLCQGGPGYIYFLRNYAITPQKLHKPSYRHVIGFWRTLAGLVSKLCPEEAAVHIFGFNLLDNEQGRQLLPMLQSLMYPNLVRVRVPREDCEDDQDILNQYFNLGRYKIWKTYQNTSYDDIDFTQAELGPMKRHYGQPVVRIAR